MKTIIFFLNLLFILQNLPAKETENAVKVTYKASHKEIAPGDTLLIEFTFEIKKGWHIYWINPGDAGLPTIIQLKENQVGKQIDVLMDVPKILKEEDLVFYCYENKTTMVSKIIIPPAANLGKNTLEFDISWLMCKNECFPGKINLKISVEIKNNSIKNNKFKLDNYPQNRLDEKIDARIIDNKVIFNIPAGKQKYLNVYPITPGYLVYNEITINKYKDNFEIILPLDKFRENDPYQLEGLFVFRNENGKIKQKSFYSTILIKN